MCGGAETKDGDNVRRIFFPHPNATLPLRLTAGAGRTHSRALAAARSKDRATIGLRAIKNPQRLSVLRVFFPATARYCRACRRAMRSSSGGGDMERGARTPPLP